MASQNDSGFDLFFASHQKSYLFVVLAAQAHYACVTSLNHWHSEEEDRHQMSHLTRPWRSSPLSDAGTVDKTLRDQVDSPLFGLAKISTVRASKLFIQRRSSLRSMQQISHGIAYRDGSTTSRRVAYTISST